MTRGRVIAFEGVDGAGKSTALALVAERLRARGTKVYLPRLGKNHVSRPVRLIREITRDRRHIELDAHTELLLYCAREAQILSELVRPAVERGETVLVDRSLLTAEILGRARGLSPEACARAAAVAVAPGGAPDLTLVFDVHPRTSRIRKRLERIRTQNSDRGGRKGLSGSGFKERVRDLYLAIARDRGYPVLHAERATPAVLAERALTLIDHGANADTGQTELDRTPQWLFPPGTELQDALARMPRAVALYLSGGLICARELRRSAADEDPALCAYGLDWDDPLREELAAREPRYALRGYTGRPLEGAGDLRLRLLERAPEPCIAALRYLDDDEADRIRERYASELPDAVLASLAYREDERAQRLRAAVFPEASDRARAAGLAGCTGNAAWALREQLFERDVAFGLASLKGVPGARAQRWLERYADAAPATVLEAIAGRADEGAQRLREALFDTGREVIDSLRGLDDEPSWALRERALPLWPSTVVHSVSGLEQTLRAQALIARGAELDGGDVHMLRRLQGLKERVHRPAWLAARRRGLAAVEALDD